MSFDVTRIAAERQSAATAQVQALFTRGASRLGERYTEAELQLAIVSFVFDDVRAGRAGEIPPSLRDMFAVFAYAAGARPDMTPSKTQELLTAFLAKHPARPDLVRELQELALELEHEDREKLASNAIAATDNAHARTTWVGPKITASPLAMLAVHEAVGQPYR